MTRGPGDLRRSLAALAAAAAFIAVVALADRFDPGLLPFGPSEALPPGYPAARLSFPLEYWNGLAALMAIGIAPLLWVAARSAPWSRGAAAGLIPLVVLTLYLTASRGGIAGAAVAIVAMLSLCPRRLELMLWSAVPALASVSLVLAVNARPEIRDSLPVPVAGDQGIEMIWICVTVGIVSAVIQYALAALVDRLGFSLPAVRRDTAAAVGGAAAFLAAVLVIAAFVSGFAGDRWQEFKQPATGETVERLGTVNSSERYYNWKAALEAAGSEKLTGIGPGTYEYYWAREGEGEQFVRDAHSLYLENLAELGPLGLMLIIAIVFGPIAAATLRLIRTVDPLSRGLLAAAVGGMAAFAFAAAIDWVWELTVLPVAFLGLASAALAPDSRQPDAEFENRGFSGSQRFLWACVSAVAILLIAVPMLGTQALDSSQRLVREGNLKGALADAERASELQPWAASPRIQEAQVQALLGRSQEGARLARQAIEKETENWRNWLVLSQLLAVRSPDLARAALKRALQLNPRSPYLRGQVRQSASNP
jgi:hypothetical protein